MLSGLSETVKEKEMKLLSLKEFCIKFRNLSPKDQQDVIDLLRCKDEISEDFFDALVEIVEDEPSEVKTFDLTGSSYPDWG